MAENVVVPASFDLLLGQISTKFAQAEAADIIERVKRLYPNRKDSFNQKDLYGALKQLYVLGAIDDDGDQKLLEILAGKTLKNELVVEIVNLVSDYKEGPSTRKGDFVGRDVDVDNIQKLVTNPRVPGVNLFGDSGVGKTTLAKEVSKRLESFDTVFIDLRDIKCGDTVYFHILQALHLPVWGDNKRERIYKHLETLSRKTFLILDSIEQVLSNESQTEQETRADFLEFLKVLISTEASKKGHLKVILTSTTKLNDSEMKHKLFTEYNVKPFNKDVSKNFISKRVRGNVSIEQQDEAMCSIADLCRNNSYLLQGAEQLMRESFPPPTNVLREITAQIKKGVPERFASISALFDSLPNDHLKQVAVKISLLRRPFSVSIAMKVAEISSGYDAELDLEMLAMHKIITAEDVTEKKSKESKRKYDIHALFRDFVTSHLCKENPVYKEQLKQGEKQFFEHFSGKLTKLANNLESEFVKTYSKLEGNRANFELAIELSEENKETLDLLLHTDDHNQFALMGILFEVLKEVTERRERFGKWAVAAEEQGKWHASAMLHCWESVSTYDSEASKAKLALDKAESSFKKAQESGVSYSCKLVRAAESLYKFSRGRLHLLIGEKANNTRKKEKKHLQKGILDLEESLIINRYMYGDHTLTARNLALLGDCHLRLHGPEKAAPFYQEAMDMKIRLVGNENHWEIPTYYHQMAQINEMLGREEEKWYNHFFGRKKKTSIKQYRKAVECMEKALALQDELGVSDTIHTAIFQRNLANILIGIREYDQALEYAQKSFEIRNAHLGENPETVRILYLIGIIHEWRKDPEAALRSYEEAFVMEESLAEDNHSVVRKLLCERLEAMCKKLNKRDKLGDYGPRIHSIIEIRSPQASPTEERVAFNYEREEEDDTISDEHVTVSPSSVGHQREEEDDTISVESVRVSPSSVGHQREEEDDTISVESVRVSISSVGHQREELDDTISVEAVTVSPSSVGHEREEEDDTISAESCLGHQSIDENACREILINLSCVKKSKTILPSPGRLDGQEPVCVSYTVFKKVVTSNKPMQIKLLGNSCNEEALSEVELSRGGYTKVARSKTEVSVEKEEKLKLDAIIYLGQHRVSILQLEWKIKKQLIWEDEVLLENQGSNLFDEKLQLCLSLHDQSENLLFKKTHPIDMMVPNEWKRLGYGGRSTDPSLLSSKLTPNPNLSDEQKRWLVVGICLNKTLLPPLRDFLNKEMETHYNDMKTRHNINNQSHGVPLSDDHGRRLNYKSINNNETRRNSHLYDYNVTSAEDLGKLYLMPCMAKFTGFDDTCDMSAVLGILSSASVFSPDVQRLAKDVRSDVRNPWGHCNFQEWTDTKLTSCFKLMKDLVQALTLPADDEKRITEELGEWETKGMDLCVDVNYKANALLKFFEMGEEQISRLLKEVQKEEAEKRTKALESIQKALEKDKDQIKGMKQQLDRHEEEIKALKLASENK